MFVITIYIYERSNEVYNVLMTFWLALRYQINCIIYLHYIQFWNFKTFFLMNEEKSQIKLTGIFRCGFGLFVFFLLNLPGALTLWWWLINFWKNWTKEKEQNGEYIKPISKKSEVELWSHQHKYLRFGINISKGKKNIPALKSQLHSSCWYFYDNNTTSLKKGHFHLVMDNLIGFLILNNTPGEKKLFMSIFPHFFFLIFIQNIWTSSVLIPLWKNFGWIWLTD